MSRLEVAILGPGGVGGLLAAALARAGTSTTVVASESTAAKIESDGIAVTSRLLGSFTARPRVACRLDQPVDVLIISTKAAALGAALCRIRVSPVLVMPLLNGVDHLAVLRSRFSAEAVVAGSVSVEAERVAPGVVVHRSSFLRLQLAGSDRSQAVIARLADHLRAAGAETSVMHSQADVIWNKLVRLNALACMTSAYDLSIGEILANPDLRIELAATIQEAAAVATAEGACVDGKQAFDQLTRADPGGGSSMQRDLRAGRPPELDAIPGAVLRAATRHGIHCPSIERLTATIAQRAQMPMPPAEPG